MANNIDVKDAASANVTMKTTDNGGVHTPHHIVDNFPGDYATQATLADVLAKLSADPATQTTLAAVLAKLTAGIPITGSVEIANDSGSTLPVSGSVSVLGSVEVSNDSGSALAVSGTVGVSTVGAGENHVGQTGGHTVMATGTFNRPTESPVVAYSANDIVSNSLVSSAPISIANAVRTGGPGSAIVLGARLVKSTANAAASGFRLWLYNASPSGLANDNTAFQIAAANKATRIGYIDLTTYVVGSDCVEYYGTPVLSSGLAYKLASGTTLYGVLQTLGAFTPGSGETFDLYVYEVQD